MSAYSQQDTYSCAFLLPNCSYANNRHCFSSKDQCLQNKLWCIIICMNTYWRNRQQHAKYNFSTTGVVRRAKRAVMTGHRKQLATLDLFHRVLLCRSCFTGTNIVWNYKGQDRGMGGMVRYVICSIHRWGFSSSRGSEFFHSSLCFPRTSLPWLFPIRKRKALGTRLLPCFPMGPQGDLHETYRNSDSWYWSPSRWHSHHFWTWFPLRSRQLSS